MPRPDYDVVIVGGGPSGAATALFLCDALPGAAERILLVDRATFPRDKICAGAIGGRAETLLASIGVRVHVPEVPIHGLSVVAAPGRMLARLPGEPIGRVVRRRAYDAALLDEARARGIEVRQGVALESLVRRARAVRLHTSAGELTTRALVGADGVGSRVRRQLGLPRGSLYAQAVEVDTPVLPDDPPRDVLHFDINDTSFCGYAWDFPTVVDGRALVCRGVYELRHGAPCASGDVDVAERLRRYLDARGVEHAALRFKRFAERGLTLHEPCAVERVLLAGEAAGIDPVLGEGIAQAILYGATAGRYLAGCLARGDYRFGDWRSTVMRSRVGLDLKIRAALVAMVYGRTRPWLERFVTRSQRIADCGMAYFGGRKVPRGQLLLSAWDLLRAL